MMDVEAAGSCGDLDPMPEFPSILGDLDFDENETQNSLPLSSLNEILPVEIPRDTDKLNKLRQAAVEISETLMLMDSSMTEHRRESTSP